MSDRQAARVPPIDVEADLSLSVEGATATVGSSGNHLVVDFESAQGALQAARARPDGSTTGLQALLTGADVTVDVQVRGATVAVLGPEANPGALSRLLGLAPAEVYAGAALWATARDLLGA